jgi:LIVCS family branched-chain amino acid:cation transporter
MNKPQKLSFIVVGLALFSMFFGSGNLIFPLFVGKLAQDQWLPATLGFFCTAVFLPFLGVVAMVTFRGSYAAFFDILGKWGGFLLTLVLLTTWIPLGSSPRCVTLAYAALNSNIPSIPLWAFSLAYCGMIWFVVAKKSRMIEILGKFLTPALLICIALIVAFGLYQAPELAKSEYTGLQMFTTGLHEGYNTMDMIASFFFSASIIEILRRTCKTESAALKHTFKACLVGIAVLGIVYVGLIGLAATHALTLDVIPKDKLLIHIAHSVLGAELGILSSIAVFLACFTTSVALVVVYADFLTEHVFQDVRRGRIALMLTIISTFLMSLTGLEGITYVTETLLAIFYPTLLVLIVINVPRKLFFQKKEEQLIEAAAA